MQLGTCGEMPACRAAARSCDSTGFPCCRMRPLLSLTRVPAGPGSSRVHPNGCGCNVPKCLE